MHYKRFWKAGTIGQYAALPRPPKPPCSAPGCTKIVLSKGLCNLHWQRMHRTGQLELRPKGGSRSTGTNGYVQIADPTRRQGGGYILEHRLVMEQQLGRPLRPHEHVHHINGVRADNRLANLELWVKPHPPGQRVEDLVAWVRSEYPEFL